MFEDKSFLESEVMLKAIKAAKEWQNALQATKTSPVSLKDLSNSNMTPRFPENALRLYSDAAWNSSSLAGCFGWAISNEAGDTLFEGQSAKRIVASVLTAEALALMAGLSMAAAAGLKDVVCFSDSRHMIDIITGNKFVIEFKGILHDLSVLSLSFSSISFRFVSRSCNEQADRLTKNALFIFSTNPSWIGDSVA